MWLGYLERGWFGALAVALPFLIPPFLIVTAIAIVYSQHQGSSLVQDIFFGVGPAVLAIIAIAAYKLARSTAKRDPVLWAIAGVQAIATVLTGSEIVWPFLAAAAFGAVYYGGGLPRFSRSAASFSPAPFFAAVKGFAWIGSGASLGALSLFFIEASAFKHPRLRGFVKGATAAAAGAIAGAAIVISRQTISGWLAVVVGLIALGLLLQRWIKVPEPAIVAVAALAGILLHS
jgi:chromate transport protein ChrA